MNDEITAMVHYKSQTTFEKEYQVSTVTGQPKKWKKKLKMKVGAVLAAFRKWSTRSALQLPFKSFAIVLGDAWSLGDAPLTRHNFAQQEGRQWRSSFIAPMASNFVVVRLEYVLNVLLTKV